MAENSYPPGGPYRSINENISTGEAHNSGESSQSENKYDASQAQKSNRNYQKPYAEKVPQWVKQRQSDMQNYMNKQNSRMHEEAEKQRFQQPEVPQWIKQQQLQMEQRLNQSKKIPPHGWNNPMPPQWNQNHRPPMRNTSGGQFAPNNKIYSTPPSGPVFRPNFAPRGFNNQQGNARPYPPVWR